MVNGAARTAPTLDSILSDFSRRFQHLESDLRQRRGFQSTETKPIGTSSGASIAGISGFLKSAGDQMLGPLAFNPSIAFIESGEIDISQDLGKSYTSYIYLNPEGAVDDTLDTISGAAFPGQMAIIQNVSNTGVITISNAGNIVGNDTEIGLAENIVFIFDITGPGLPNGSWRIFSGGSGGDLSQWSKESAVSDIDFANFDGVNIDRLFFNIDSGTFANTDNVIVRNISGFTWNLSDVNDGFFFRHNGVANFLIGQNITSTKELDPLIDNTYDIGAAALNYKNSYIRNLLEVRNIQGPDPSNSLMKIIFDSQEDSDTYFSNSTSADDRINAVVNGVNIWHLVHDGGGYEMGLGTSVDIQLAVNSNWIHFETRIAQDPVNNSEGNVFFDSADDTLKIRKKDSGGVLSTVSLEGAVGPPGSVEGVQDFYPWLLHETSQYDEEIFMSNSKVGAGTTTVSYLEDFLYFVPIYLAQRTRLTSLAVTISAPAPAGTYTLSFGIYENRMDGQNYPEDRIVSGNLLSTGTGVKRTTGIAQDLEAGLYWLAFNCTTDDLEMEFFLEGNCNSVGFKFGSISFQPIIGFFTAFTGTLLPSSAPDDLIEAAQSSNGVPAIYAKFEPNTS